MRYGPRFPLEVVVVAVAEAVPEVLLGAALVPDPWDPTIPPLSLSLPSVAMAAAGMEPAPAAQASENAGSR